LAEWSKALAPGASPQGRGFEPHSCHCRSASARTAAVLSPAACHRACLPAATCQGKSAAGHRSLAPSRRRVGRVPAKTPTMGLEPTTTRSGPCALPTERGALLAVLDVGIIIHDSNWGAIDATDKAKCNLGRIRPRRNAHCRPRTGGKRGGRRHGTPERPRGQVQHTLSLNLNMITATVEVFQQDNVSEWFRRRTRSPLGSARRVSNPLAVVLVPLAASQGANIF
jgi:hypothetical protein